MTISKSKLLLPFVILFVGGAVSASASAKVTRSSESDTLTNPNHTAIDKCQSGATMRSFFQVDTCRTYDSVNTQAVCINPSPSLRCRCLLGYPSYLAHLRKCVSLPQLSVDVFGQGSKGCSPRLEIKGEGGDAVDDAKMGEKDDDENDEKKDVCKMMSWNRPVVVINFKSSSNPKIKFCGQQKIKSCDLVAVRYSGVGDWQTISDFKEKIGKDSFFQWNKARMSPFSQVLIVVNLRCKQNSTENVTVVSISSCFMVKTSRPQTVSINQPTTTETITKTTSVVATTKTEPTEHAELTESTNGGNFLYNSKESNKKSLTIAVVAVMCAVIFFALSITAVCFVKKRKQRRQIPENTRPTPPLDDQSIHLYDDVYESQNNAYQLLQRDGNSGHWEQAAYQSLAKGTSAGNRSQVEESSNPSTYQDLQRSGTVSIGDLPVYQSLVKQQENSTENALVDDCGYLLLPGEHDKMEGTADSSGVDNPYYHKLEEHDKVGTATDSGEANPCCYTLEQVHE